MLFSGTFNAGAKMQEEGGRLVIDREGHAAKVVPKVDHISFASRRAVAEGRRATCVTERCVMQLTREGLKVSEVAGDRARDHPRLVRDAARGPPLRRAGGAPDDGDGRGLHGRRGAGAWHCGPGGAHGRRHGGGRVLSRAPRATELVKMMIAAAEGEERERVVEALAGVIAAGSADLKEGLAAFREKRAPRWEVEA
jgi:hypothetical protein